MNVQELLTSNANVSVTIGLADLREFASALISATKRELEAAVAANKNESYLTPQQVSELLGVDLSTLWRWKKRGYLNHIEVGGKRRYKQSDIDTLLKKGGAA